MQKVKGVKVTRKVKIVKRKFCIKKRNMFTLIAMNFVQEQLEKIKFRPIAAIFLGDRASSTKIEICSAGGLKYST